MSEDKLPEKKAKAKVRIRQTAMRAQARTRRRPPRLSFFPHPLRKVYRRWGAAAARLIDSVAGDDRRRLAVSLLLAFSINFVVFALMSVFAKVRIFIPNAPRSTINVTLVELQRPELPLLRDPELIPEPEPEPEPEIVEEPEPEPEPEPDPVPEPEPPVEPEPAPEPEPEPEPEPAPPPEPEPILDLDPEPIFAPPAEDPEPLIPDPAIAAEDDLSLPSPETEEPQTPVEEALEPLITVEPEQRQEAGLDELIGEEDADGEDAAGADEEDIEEEIEEEAPEEPLQNDDMFDVEPSFSGRRFVAPQVDLPTGEAPLTPGSSGIVAIFCPEEFSDEDKAKECAGRPDIRSGWRPGDSGEDWSRATALIKGARERGAVGPSAGPTARELERARNDRLIRDITDPTRNIQEFTDPVGSIGAEAGIGSGAGPEPSWTLREYGDLTQKEIDDLKKALEEAEENR